MTTLFNEPTYKIEKYTNPFHSHIVRYIVTLANGVKETFKSLHDAKVYAEGVKENKLIKVLQKPTSENETVIFVWGKEVRSLKITTELTGLLGLGEESEDLRGDEVIGYSWAPYPAECLNPFELSQVIAEFQSKHTFEGYRKAKRKNSINLVWRNRQKRALDPIHKLSWEYEKDMLYGNPQSPEWWGHRIKAA